MTQVQSADHTTHPSNFRAEAEKLVTDEWWFGFEQEFFFTDPETGDPLGWENGEPKAQGDYYCGVGAGNVVGREISDIHLQACLDMGITLTGTNAEVALGQWEYQCLGKGIKAADDLWVSRYLLYKIAEEFGVGVNIHPKPKTGDWNGSGMHTNFSNEEMRSNGTEELFSSMCDKLGKVHAEGIASYGSDNDMRLTGLHETQSIDQFSYGVSDRGASIRIPIYTVEHNWNGYLEDRRPASNADPYKILTHLVGTLTK
jgi:glutamine synthetase